jgi:DNA-binding NtrC family response regulator
VGSNREIDMDVRLIAATNRNLEEMIQKGTFREDLFYRLNVIPIYLPPLRERKDDIEKLVQHFVNKFNNLHKKRVLGVSGQAMELLLKHNWPGNIRELENVVEHSFVIESGERISPSSLPGYVRGGVVAAASEMSVGATQAEASVDPSFEPTTNGEALLDYKSFKEQFEKEFIIKALKTFKGRINQTAMHAKIPKKTLLRKLQKYGIKAEDYRS